MAWRHRMLLAATAGACLVLAPATRASVLAVLGASFTAGVGPDNPNRSWAVLLARLLR